MSDATPIIATALIVGVPSLIGAVASLSNRKHLRTGNGQNVGEYLPIIAAAVTTLGNEQVRVREELVEQRRASDAALVKATEDVKAEVARASDQWAETLKVHTESDQRNFEELRSLVSPQPEGTDGTQ